MGRERGRGRRVNRGRVGEEGEGCGQGDELGVGGGTAEHRINWFQGSGLRAQGSGLLVQGPQANAHSSVRPTPPNTPRQALAQGSGRRAQGSGFRAQGPGLRAQGSGLRAQPRTSSMLPRRPGVGRLLRSTLPLGWCGSCSKATRMEGTM